MGFKITPKGYRLKFSTPEMDGFEVVARSLNTGKFLEFQAAQAQQAAGGEKAASATEQMLEMLAASLISWNAEDEEGQPIPTTMDGLKTLDLDFNMEIIRAWMDAINGVPDPLPKTSAAGKPSAEVSIPMDVSFESLAS